MITNINISKLRPHPNNPRKVIGDITELSDSIKKNGIFQNLTVIPTDDEMYTIIIGHRRFAAAKEAGLQELPCAIVEMTEKEQLSTMLLENMQREDLTVLEQAEGFQMMLDLGESVNSISEQTGFSKTTIRHRVELLKLDKKVLQSQSKEIPLSVYIKLEKIKDIDRRNKVLNSVGTNNFEWELGKAIREEKAEKGRAYWTKELSEMEATDISNVDNHWMDYVSQYYISFADDKDEAYEKIPKEHFYYRISGEGFCIYKKREQSDTQTAEEAARAEKHAKAAKTASELERIKDLCKEKVTEFCHSFRCKRDSEAQTIFQLYLVLEIRQAWYGELDLTSLMSEEEQDDLVERDAISLSDIPIVRDVPAALLAVAVDSYVNFKCYYDSYTECEYRENICLKATYECLMELGYEASDEEIEYINGTHELFEQDTEIETA